MFLLLLICVHRGRAVWIQTAAGVRRLRNTLTLWRWQLFICMDVISRWQFECSLVLRLPWLNQVRKAIKAIKAVLLLLDGRTDGWMDGHQRNKTFLSDCFTAATNRIIENGNISFQCGQMPFLLTIMDLCFMYLCFMYSEMSLICGMTMMTKRRKAAFQRSGSVTLPSGPLRWSQRPPTALSTSRNSSNPRSQDKDGDEDWKPRRALTKTNSHQKRLPDVRVFIFMQVNKYNEHLNVQKNLTDSFCATKWRLFMLKVFQTTSTRIETFPFCYCSFV